MLYIINKNYIQSHHDINRNLTFENRSLILFIKKIIIIKKYDEQIGSNKNTQSNTSGWDYHC